MTLNLTDLCDDLLAETADLTPLVEGLDEAGWVTPTPAEGWTVKDQIGHLAHYDEVATIAVADPEQFAKRLEEQLANPSIDESVERWRAVPGAEVLAALEAARAQLVATVTPLDPSTRVAWYGPAMSLASFVTARIMETWAHGQDVVDALGLTRPPTARLRHVAFIGARALPNSYVTRGLPVPKAPVRVELVAPDGDSWTFGPADAVNVVRGPALDFCLVVTQRRHPADTALVASGPVATEWLTLAQAFAGPAGKGRQPGQFAGSTGGPS
jgi:uncharacterized protein (TIGR03084 family)